MPINAPNTTARNIAYIVGTLLLALGVITLIHPQIMGRYGLIADTTHSIMSIPVSYTHLTLPTILLV